MTPKTLKGTGMTGIIGHRGGRNIWPENSLEGFRNLLDVPVAGVEFDLHLSDAGEILVVHDALLERTTNGNGPVRALSPKARRAIRLNDSNECIPTLDDVLEIYSDCPLDLHIELKADETGQPYVGLPEKAVEVIDKFNLRNRSVLTSFNLDVLSQCRDVAPDIRRLCSMNETSTRTTGFEKSLIRAAEMVDIIAVHQDLLNKNWLRTVELVPKKRLCAWVVNTHEDITHWLNRGTAFITTDEPILAQSLRDAHSPN
jgi:glycerophosphoryl diester phosphodiesterase